MVEREQIQQNNNCTGQQHTKRDLDDYIHYHFIPLFFHGVVWCCRCFSLYEGLLVPLLLGFWKLLFIL